MSGLLLRLAGPLQSWGERSKFDWRDTAGFPTRSGLIGLIAGALGRKRGDPLDDLTSLSFTIRVDRPGVRVIDYHTTGGWLSGKRKVPTADGAGRGEGKGTVQTWREYLADAVFVVAVTGPDQQVNQVHEALERPRWQPFLGRRSCPPEQPMVLGSVTDPEAELRSAVPLARHAREDTEIVVDFIRDSGATEDIRSELYDIPTNFTPIDRVYRPRPIWIEPIPLPISLAVFSLADYPRRLATYIQERH